jgi:hypothetical protein
MTSRLLLALVFNGALVTTCIYAVVRGDRPEKIGASINIVASGLTTVLRLANPHFYAPAELMVLSIDAMVVAGFYWLAISTTRFWPIWAFGFAVANIFVSIAGGLNPKTPLFAYHTGLGLYAYLALASLVIGTFHLPKRGSAFRDGRRVPTQRPPLDDNRANLARRIVDKFTRKNAP